MDTRSTTMIQSGGRWELYADLGLRHPLKSLKQKPGETCQRRSNASYIFLYFMLTLLLQFHTAVQEFAGTFVAVILQQLADTVCDPVSGLYLHDL